ARQRDGVDGITPVAAVEDGPAVGVRRVVVTDDGDAGVGGRNLHAAAQVVRAGIDTDDVAVAGVIRVEDRLDGRLGRVGTDAVVVVVAGGRGPVTRVDCAVVDVIDLDRRHDGERRRAGAG